MFGKKNKELDFDMVTTRGGDKGESRYYSGELMRKDDIVFETVGELDTLNSYIGLVRSKVEKEEHKKFLKGVQSDIIRLSGLVATSTNTKEGKELYEGMRPIEDRDINALELFQKRLMKKTKIESAFILPGDSEISAVIDIARTQARAAERRLVTLIRDRERTDLFNVQKYVNRLSDVFFVLGRYYSKG